MNLCLGDDFDGCCSGASRIDPAAHHHGRAEELNPMAVARTQLQEVCARCEWIGCNAKQCVQPCVGCGAIDPGTHKKGFKCAQNTSVTIFTLSATARALLPTGVEVDDTNTAELHAAACSCTSLFSIHRSN